MHDYITNFTQEKHKNELLESDVIKLKQKYETESRQRLQYSTRQKELELECERLGKSLEREKIVKEELIHASTYCCASFHACFR